MKKIKILLFYITFILLIVSCTNTKKTNPVVIDNKDYIELEEGSTYKLKVKENSEITGTIVWESNDSSVSVDNNGNIIANYPGNATVKASFNEYSDSVTIVVKPVSNIKITISTVLSKYKVGDVILINASCEPTKFIEKIKYNILEGSDIVTVNNNSLTTISEGIIKIQASIYEYKSNILELVVEEIKTQDPYLNITKEEFYADYKPASSYLDSYYRTLHGLMSGDISPQDQTPTISNYQPSENGVLLKNSDALYSSDGNTYYIVDAYGQIVNQIYKGGAYVSLEEVAAYMLAFNDLPANHVSKKSGRPTESIWGEYLRCNHSKFIGDTSRYPYEPELPDISGCGGYTVYYEMDLGTTGTDCDPSYQVVPYNDGKKITRGAARIVYSKYDRNGNDIIDINEKHVFYTYNHYNDFQEYLNYQGGWGEMFGNITGGGCLSSKTDYNPTPYIPVKNSSFKELTIQNIISKNTNSIFFDKLFQY